MKALTGLLNQGTYVSFELKTRGDKTKVKGPKNLVKGTSTTSLGYFNTISSINTEEMFLTYTDVSKAIRVVGVEDKRYPKVKIYTKLPQPDKLHVSEFFLEGHFRINTIIIGDKKIPGEKVYSLLEDNNAMIIGSKLAMKKVGEPAIIMRSLETSYGNVEYIKPTRTLEI